MKGDAMKFSKNVRLFGRIMYLLRLEQARLKAVKA